MKKLYVAAIFLVCIITTIVHAEQSTNTPTVLPYINFRSQGVNAARHAVVSHHMNEFLNPSIIFTATPEYKRNFREDRITRCLFGNNLIGQCNPTLIVSGSSVQNRRATDLLADYFYLPTDFSSQLTFIPRIDNVIIDLNVHYHWCHGLYTHLYIPFVHTRADLNMNEKTIQRGFNNHPAGYFGPALLNRNQLLNDFASYAQGQTIDPIILQTGGQNFTITAQALQHAKISPKRRVKTRLADIRAQCGWNFIHDTYKEAGIFVETAAPTGNKPEGIFLLEPIASNGHHWEFGGGLHGSYCFWHNEETDHALRFTGNIVVTHLFDTKQKRVFDLKNKPLSRYMLAQRLGIQRRTPQLTADADAGFEFQREFAPVANITRLCVDVSIAAQIDLVTFFTYTHDGFSWDLGYNFWLRTKEDITQRGVNQLQNNTTWALKGDAQVFGFNMNVPVHLAATQNNATINTGTNATNAVAGDATQAANTNIGVDNATLATTTMGQVVIAPGSNIATRTSNPVVFIKESDVALQGNDRAHSSKLFTHVNYTWYEYESWAPFLGFGGEVEFDHSSDSCSSHRCALSQWGVWAKAGIAFE